MLERIVEGYIPAEEEAAVLMDPARVPLSELVSAAKAVTRKFHGNMLEMCAIHAAKVGRCSGDCAFCAQSAHHKCSITPVEAGDIDPDEVVRRASELSRAGVGRFSLVTSGERLNDSEFAHILRIYERLREETKLALCASLGSLDEERARLLVKSGVTRYHHNIETARSFFPSICTTHSYDDKLKTIKTAREAGMEICCGGIISLGETPRQRVEMAYALRSLDVDSVPINILNPIKGTRLEGQTLLEADEIVRTVAVFRLILQDKTLRFAGGRQAAMGEKEYAGYEAGINALLAGDFLTTPGNVLKREIEKLAALGYSVKE